MRSLSALLRLIRAIWRAYWQDDCLILSAAVSFYTILSVIPFILLLFVFWGLLVGTSDVLHGQISQFITTLIPEVSTEVLDDIRIVVSHRGALGWVGVFFLLWIFDLVFYSIAHAFDRIFGKGKRRRYYRMKVASLTALVFSGAVAYLFVKVAVLATAIQQTDVTIMDMNLSLMLAKGLSFKYLIYFFLIAMITTMYSIVPTTEVRFPFAFLGGVLFVNLWYIARFAFRLYVENVAVFNIVYGTLGALIIVVFWIFYSANILLICAECVSVVQHYWLNRGVDKAA